MELFSLNHREWNGQCLCRFIYIYGAFGRKCTIGACGALLTPRIVPLVCLIDLTFGFILTSMFITLWNLIIMLLLYHLIMTVEVVIILKLLFLLAGYKIHIFRDEWPRRPHYICWKPSFGCPWMGNWRFVLQGLKFLFLLWPFIN